MLDRWLLGTVIKQILSAWVTSFGATGLAQHSSTFATCRKNKPRV
jgi:hypothetical protein